jgi:hypothetical protein
MSDNGAEERMLAGLAIKTHLNFCLGYSNYGSILPEKIHA